MSKLYYATYRGEVIVSGDNDKDVFEEVWSRCSYDRAEIERTWTSPRGVESEIEFWEVINRDEVSPLNAEFEEWLEDEIAMQEDLAL